MLSTRTAPLLAAALLLGSLAGCQSRRAVIPPPGSLPVPSDPYYNRPAGVSTGAPASPAAPVNLSPSALPNLPAPPVTSGTSNSLRGPRDTYDVATRVAADGQPIRVLDSTNPTSSVASRSGGMTINDGTTARPWLPGSTLPPPTVANNPFSQLRGGSSTPGSLPQGFSGQDGQWRSRSSYEATERR
jgi:hypothetical protein